MDVKKLIAGLDLDYSNPQILALVNIIEILCAEITKVTADLQACQDEINRLKGEKGKPNIKGNKKNEINNNHSSETERKKKKKHKKSSKKGVVKIDRTVRVHLDKTALPDDLKFKGYQEHLVQNVIITSDNVMFEKEVWYSASAGETYIAETPDGLQGEEFHHDLKAYINYLAYEMSMSQKDIKDFLATAGVSISEGTISNILINEKSEELTEEVADIFLAGLSESIWSAIDDTSLRVGGINHYCNVIGNDLFTIYSTQLSKSKDTIKDVVFPKEIRELFEILLSDDAPQFKMDLIINALCWIHELRHFKKLNPLFEVHQKELEEILTRLWDYYHKLLKYKINPTENDKEMLLKEFDSILNTEVNYDELAKRMELTKDKKERLLVVLDYPSIPLHNNDMELGARTVVKKRKISGGLRSHEGKIAWDNNFSILATCRKQGVSYLEYMKNIFSGKGNPVTLAQLIKEKGDETSPGCA